MQNNSTQTYILENIPHSVAVLVVVKYCKYNLEL